MLSSCSENKQNRIQNQEIEKKEQSVTVDSINGTVWTRADYIAGLTNATILTFTSNDECNWMTVGTTSEKQTTKFKYVIGNNKIALTSITGNLYGTYECVLEKENLLMCDRTPKAC